MTGDADYLLRVVVEAEVRLRLRPGDGARVVAGGGDDHVVGGHLVLDEVVVDGVETTLPLFRTLVRNTDIQNGAYDTAKAADKQLQKAKDHVHQLEQFVRRFRQRAQGLQLLLGRPAVVVGRVQVAEEGRPRAARLASAPAWRDGRS